MTEPRTFADRDDLLSEIARRVLRVQGRAIQMGRPSETVPVAEGLLDLVERNIKCLTPK